MQTRYTVKYRHHESKLVLKVTDDVVVRTPDLMSIESWRWSGRTQPTEFAPAR